MTCDKRSFEGAPCVLDEGHGGVHRATFQHRQKKQPSPSHAGALPGPNHVGSHANYVNGCRCSDCKKAHAENNKNAYRRKREANLALREHLAALRARTDMEAAQ